VISNRIFEICSVGAVALCPDIPWIRKWFGHTVIYFDAIAPEVDIAQQIIEIHKFCSKNPRVAQEKAAQARVIFEKYFAAERMLENAISYHEEKQRKTRASRTHQIVQPEISVVVRCGSRPIEMVRAAVDSIRRQTMGRFVVIFSKYEDIDLSSITADKSGAITEFQEIFTPNAKRGATLAAGLRLVNTEFFAVLDDDDFWLSEHIACLFQAACAIDRDFDVAFSGSVAVTREGKQIETSLVWDRNIYAFGLAADCRETSDVTAAFSSNCFVARRELLDTELFDAAVLDTAEDSLLVAIVIRRMAPVFSYRATAFFRRGYTNESNFDQSPARAEDLLSLKLRTGFLFSPEWLSRSLYSLPSSSHHATWGIEALKARVAAMEASTSWRVTAPMRAVMRGLRKAIRVLRGR